MQEEGRKAIDEPGAPNAPEIPPEDYILRKLLTTWKIHVALQYSDFNPNR